MISLRKEMDDAERFSARFEALMKAFLGVAEALPKTCAAPASESAGQIRRALNQATDPLSSAPDLSSIQTAGAVALEQIEVVRRSNGLELGERDAAVREVLDVLADAVRAFKGSGEAQATTLGELASGFEAIAEIEDVKVLRSRLKEDAGRLRQSLEAINGEYERCVLDLQHQMYSFQQRMETAARSSTRDVLTGLGSRRQAEQALLKLREKSGSVCVALFDIRGFREMNHRRGAIFCDQVLKALAHLLGVRFPEVAQVFRWGADEFLVVLDGSETSTRDRCMATARTFAEGKYVTTIGGVRVTLSGDLDFAVTQYRSGETVDALYRRTREALELSARGVRM